MKKTAGIFLALLLVLLMFSSSLAEQTTLRYSYGQEAHNKHLLDMMNTVEYGGKTYTFDFGGFWRLHDAGRQYPYCPGERSAQCPYGLD